MTKIGVKSRAELLTWIEPACPGRLHVPAWSAHEYLRHHTRGTLVDELKKKTNELSTLAGGTFGYFRPFLDDPIGGAVSADAQQVAAREALTGLKALAATAASWPKTYEAHAQDVIGFINRHVFAQSSIFQYFETIEALGEGRYTGRVPPGFQDRNKKDEKDPVAEVGDLRGVGSNTWGDLLFWRELLDHAGRAKAKTIVILTNDRKNDWHMGGGSSGEADERSIALRSSWKPVPRPHPMLVFEAHTTAGVDDVVLLDSQYLGNVLDQIVGSKVKGFVDVAVVPDPPDPPTEKERRNQAVRQAKAQAQGVAGGSADAAPERFADREGLSGSKSNLRRAVLASRDGAAVDQTVLDFEAEVAAQVVRGASIVELLDDGHMHRFDHSQLVQLSRRLHERAAAGEAGYVAAVADLAGVLPELPRQMANCLYMGLFASMYLDPNLNEVRLPPKSPIAMQIFGYQKRGFAALPMETLKLSIERAAKAPLYTPLAATPDVLATFGRDHDVDEGLHLRSLRVAGEELLTPAQPVTSLRLRDLLGERPPTALSILSLASEIFAVPLEQLVADEDLQTQFTIEPELGFKEPGRVSIDKPEAD